MLPLSQRKYRLLFLFLPLLSLLLGACSRLEIATVTLEPYLVGTREAAADGREGACVGLNRSGTASSVWFLEGDDAPQRDDPEIMLFGYDNYYRPGDDPFPCNHWVGHTFQAMMLFDLESTGATHVMSARLEFDVRRVVYTDGLSYDNCMGPVARATEPWSWGLSVNYSGRDGMLGTTNRRGSVTSTGFYSANIDVTQISRQMLQHENFGYVLNPDPDEIWDIDVTQECVGRVENPRLILEIVRPVR